MNKSDLENHIAGALYGFAIGDSIGATTEFMTSEQISDKYGEVTTHVGGGWLGLEPGEVTDDTQMMICVIDALLENYNDIYKFRIECADNFAKWYFGETEFGDPKDIGNTCLESICHFIAFGSFVERNENKLGNGSLMRYLPCALLKLDNFNIAQGLITHNSKICSEAILKASEAIWNSIDGKYTEGYGNAPYIPSGKVTNTLMNALYYSSSGDFNHTLRSAVNNGGDADTIAAIACSFAGARVGIDGIDDSLIDPLDEKVKRKLDMFIEFSVDYLFNK